MCSAGQLAGHGADPPDILADIAQTAFHPGGHAGLLVRCWRWRPPVPAGHSGAGGKRWQALHCTVYAAALLAVLHFFWMRAGKNDFAEVAPYAAIIAAPQRSAGRAGGCGAGG